MIGIKEIMNKAKEYKELSVGELELKVSELKKEHFNYRMRAKLGQIESPRMIRNTKRDIARLLTIIQEKKRGAE